MKRHILTLILALAALAAQAQYQLPNSGFESFESDGLHGTGVRPVSWQASNVLQFGFSMYVCSDNASGHTGHCVQIENTSLVGATSPGWVTLGSPWASVESLTKINEATAGTDGGVAWTHRPDSLSVWIRRTNGQGENAHIVLYMWTGTSRGDRYRGQNGNCVSTTHYDEQSDIRQVYDGNPCGTAVQATQVAECLWRNNQQFDNWTEIKLPIQYLNNSVPEKMNIIFCSGNYPNHGSTNIHDKAKLFVDDLTLIYSSRAHEVLLNNRAMAGFSPDNLVYTYTLGATATTVPQITLKRSGRLLDPQEYTINYAPVGDTTTVTIRAEDGSSTTTYKILFTTQLSTNSRLADIRADGQSIPGFNPLVYNYNLTVPYGTSTYPAITYTPGESGQTVVVNTPQQLPGAITVVSTAPDPAYSSTYTLNYTVAPLQDNTLQDIKVNGRTITGYNPQRNSYVVELPMGTTADPVITYTSAYPQDQIVVVTNNGLSGGATVAVTPRGTTNTRTYRLTFRITASTYSYLADLKLDGQTIDGFAPDRFVYYDTLAMGTTALPQITAEPGDEYQTVNIQTGGIDGQTRVTVTAQSGAQTIYRINFTTLRSSISHLNSIMLDGEQLPGFLPGRTDYSVSLPVGTTALPEITWTPGDEYETVTLQSGGLDGITRIVVRAGDGTTRTYTITFASTLSTNSRLARLMVNGQDVPGWDADVTVYTIALPRGTTEAPIITWTVGDPYQTVRKTDGGLTGDTRVTVKAQDGTSTVYIIRFTVEANTATHLAGITVGTQPLEGFHPDTLDYSITLAGGTTALPAITYTKGDPSETVAVSRGGVNGVSTITVIAENGEQRVYNLHFTVEMSANALLQDIRLGGVSLPGFRPEQLTYRYTVPLGTTACPAVDVVKEAGQRVTISGPAIVGTIRIVVTPEIGEQNIYLITVHYPESDNALLAGITVGGHQLAGFTPERRTYSVASTEAALPLVAALPGDSLQTIHIATRPAERSVLISVRAENGDTALYTVSFPRRQSSVATLSSLSVGGQALTGFAADRYDYAYTLPAGATTAPALGYTLTDTAARATVARPKADGRATIAVTSADGTATHIYNVDFAFARSSDALLSAVTADGRAIPMSDFVNDTARLALAHDAAAPVIAYTRGLETQTVFMANGGLNGTDIIVRAEDGTEQRYIIRYTVAPSRNSRLAALNIAGFDPQTTTYNIVLPWRTRLLPVLSPVTADREQSVRVEYGGLTGATTVTVTAGDGSTTVYTINYSVARSSAVYLEAIYADGSLLPAFDRDQTDYHVTLPVGTTAAPKLTWDLALADDGTDITEQRVEYYEGTVADTSRVIVTAEDGTERTYNVSYSVAEPAGENQLTLITLAGEMLEGYAPAQTEYTVVLPAGTAVLPEIGYVKAFAQQTVEIENDGAEGTTLVRVLSNRSDSAVTTYTLHTTVAEVGQAQLASIELDGVAMAGFHPAETSYIVPVTQKPAVTYTAATGYTADITADNAKTTVIEVTDGLTTETYTLHYYYSNDIIPNADFSQWENAAHNGSKPVAWDVPGNAADCYKWGAQAKVCTGNEISPITNGVQLNTHRDQLLSSIYGSVPGITTLGTFSLSFGASGGSTSGVSGGITFRNTPDQLQVEAMPESTSNIDHWQFWMQLTDGASIKKSTYSGDFSNLNSWRTAVLNLDYSGLNRASIAMMNITLNAGDQDNCHAYGGGTQYKARVQYRNLHFVYNSRLSSLSVDGTPLAGFSADTHDYNLTLDAEYQGHPHIAVTGEVADQAHRVIFSEWENNQMTATVRVTGEDGVQQTDYRIRFTRPQSADSRLAAIRLDGQPLAGFAASITDYTVALAAGSRLPDIEAVKDIAYADLDLSREHNAYVIRVRAENGDSTVYRVSFVRAADNNAQLAGLTVAGHPEVSFDPATTSYTYNLAADEAEPRVSFARAADGQRITQTADAITVTALNGARTVYRLNAVRAALAPAGALTALTVNGEDVAGFTAAQHNYRLDVTGRDSVVVAFAGHNRADRLATNVTPDRVTVSLGSTDYVVELVRRASADNALTSLERDNRPVDGFSDAIYDYDLPLGRDAHPELYTASDAALSLGTTADGFSVTATAANGRTAVTNIRLVPELDTVTTLAGIYLDGELISRVGRYRATLDFNPVVNDYTVSLPAAEPKIADPAMPAIEAVAAAPGQTITIATDGIRGTTVVTVRSESGRERDYTVTFRPEQSANNLLADLAVDYRSLADFDPQTTAYTFAVPAHEAQPVISYTPGDAFQTVAVNNYSSHAEVVVTAENGSTRTYSVAFYVSRSSNSLLNNLLTDGQAVEGFDADRFNYTVTLPVGTRVAPTVTVIAGDDGQSISVIEGGLDAPTTVVVTAEDGSSTRFYSINFDVTRSAVDTLAMIYVNGTPLSDYAGHTLNYSYTLPLGFNQLPIVTYDPGDEYQTARLSVDSARMIYSVNVTAESGATATYIVSFQATLSHNAQLGCLFVDGDTIAGFDPERRNYIVNLPVGTTRVPELTWAEGDAYQTVEYTPAATVNDQATVEVTAGDGIVSRVYRVTFVRTLSSNSLLSDLRVNGISISGFRPDSTAYTVAVAGEVHVEVLPGDAYQTIDSVTATVGGTYFVTVHAEDRSHTVYSIKLDRILSSNARLAEIRVNGVDLTEFDAEQLDYTLTLPYGQTLLPSVAAVPEEPGLQHIIADVARTLGDTTYFRVTAEDGIHRNTYRLFYRSALSDNANLAAIYIGGEPLTRHAEGFKADADFSEDVYMYNIELPYGTTELPEITYTTAVPDVFHSSLDTGGVNGISFIRITSQDEQYINVYDLRFTVELSHNALLKDISFADGMLRGFQSSEFDYEVVYPLGTDTASLPKPADISFVKMEEGQTVSVSQSFPTEMVVTVTAVDGVTVNAYYFSFRIKQSDNNLLRDILVDGLSIRDFEPTDYTYTYYVYQGQLVPEIVGVPSDSLTQRVDVTPGQVNETTYIYVTAEDGSEAVYEVKVEESPRNTADRPWVDEVSFLPLGNGDFKASTYRKGVTLMITTVTGAVIYTDMVGIVEANDNIKDEHHAGGTVIHFERLNQYYIYTFLYDGRVLKSGKFCW